MMLAERGVEGVGIEPDRSMARVARRKLAEYPAWRVEISDFEPWEPAAGEQFDLVSCAQAWHWVDRERGTSQAERLLRRGGWLAIFGHVPNPPDTPLRHRIDAIYEELAPRCSARSEAPAERVAPGAAFGPPLHREYSWSHDYTAERWIGLLQTSSDHKMLSSDRRELLFTRIRDAINQCGGTYRHHSVCKLWAAQRK